MFVTKVHDKLHGALLPLVKAENGYMTFNGSCDCWLRSSKRLSSASTLSSMTGCNFRTDCVEKNGFNAERLSL